MRFSDKIKNTFKDIGQLFILLILLPLVCFVLQQLENHIQLSRVCQNFFSSFRGSSEWFSRFRASDGILALEQYMHLFGIWMDRFPMYVVIMGLVMLTFKHITLLAGLPGLPVIGHLAGFVAGCAALPLLPREEVMIVAVVCGLYLVNVVLVFCFPKGQGGKKFCAALLSPALHLPLSLLLSSFMYFLTQIISGYIRTANHLSYAIGMFLLPYALVAAVDFFLLTPVKTKTTK